MSLYSSSPTEMRSNRLCSGFRCLAKKGKYLKCFLANRFRAEKRKKKDALVMMEFSWDYLGVFWFMPKLTHFLSIRDLKRFKIKLFEKEGFWGHWKLWGVNYGLTKLIGGFWQLSFFLYKFHFGRCCGVKSFTSIYVFLIYKINNLKWLVEIYPFYVFVVI